MDTKKPDDQTDRPGEREQAPFAPEGPLPSKRRDRGIALRLRPPSFFRRLMASRWRDLGLLVMVILMGAGMLVGLSHLEGFGPSSPSRQTAPPPSKTAPTPLTPLPPERVSVQVVSPHLFPLPPPNVGLMQPAIDANGHLWVGEMTANRLARLETKTGRMTSWTPPGAKGGLMTTAVDREGKIWFVEQSADYIGRFDPAEQTFQTFPLGTVQGQHLGPQALQFDRGGQLWFTAPSGGRIGRLDPSSGTITLWPIPEPAPGVPAAPFSLAITPEGEIWFGLITGGVVGQLDPVSGQATLYSLPDPQTSVFSMASDQSGRVWFTELMQGKLGMLDTGSKQLVEYPVPETIGQPFGLYGLVTAPDGTVWVAANALTALIRYEPDRAAYTFFQFSDRSLAPYGLTIDDTGQLWFTASGSTGSMIGALSPAQTD